MPVDYYICPSCGDEIAVGSRGCPRCAREEATKKWHQIRVKKKKTPPTKPRPWEQDEVYDGLDLPEEDFDYEKFIKKEFGQKRNFPASKETLWRFVGLILLIALASGFILCWLK